MADFRLPDGYAARYRTAGGGTVLAFDPGTTPRGAAPIEQVPFWLGSPGEIDAAPIDLVLYCPKCGHQHIDQAEAAAAAEFAQAAGWTNPPHRTHQCHRCAWRWRPSDVCTQGVPAVKTRGGDRPVVETAAPASTVVPAIAEAMLIRMLRHFHRPNPENPRDWRVAPGEGVELSRDIHRVFSALGELAHGLATRPPSLERYLELERAALDIAEPRP